MRDLTEEVELGRQRVEEINGMPVVGRIQCSYGWGTYPGQVVGGTGVGYPGVYGNRCWNGMQNDRQRSKLEADRRALAHAREDLADLERRAAFAAVPLEWRR